MTSPFDTEWDAIVIGAGMGGGTLGRALAEAGQKVLFVEKGAEGCCDAEAPRCDGCGKIKGSAGCCK